MSKPSRREIRIRNAMLAGVSGVLAVTVLGLLVNALAPHASGFWSGFKTGLLVVLPFALLLMFWRGYRQMDEYGQRLQQRAGSFAFVCTMLAVTVAYALQDSLHFPVLLWEVYVFGILCWGLAAVYLNRRERA